ncbi:hypothetical protein [Saccharothrix obliqua]|uniref:hypothetical protein n=1 Tax=Saccharothrix obliqua TaxID=2861747 RepID=UPI001C5FE236|nr:hypothetical protein [Saccharothrix obliqua]MBW4717213.1 hypothetical protein [Saccharothrix obliqua]
MDMEQLLWRLADRYAPASLVPHARPKRFDHAGDLVVGDGRVSWDTPGWTEGGFSHALPPGTHPVHVGAYTDEDRDLVSVVVIPLAEPARIAAARWNRHGYDDIHPVEDYAVLWGEDAMRATLPHEDGLPSFFPGARDRIAAEGGRGWPNVVLDRETGANALVFPVEAENVDGHEITDDDGNLLCLVLTAFDR